jgi:hypothetical protein
MSQQEVNMSNPGSPKGQTTKPFVSPSQGLCKSVVRKSDLRYTLTGEGVRAIKSIRTARDIRHLAGLSLTAMSERIEQAIGRRYTGGAIANLESGKRRSRDRVWSKRAPRFKLTDDVSAVYRSILSETIDAASHGAITLRTSISRWGVWHVSPIARCAICGDEFIIKRAGAARCSWCIRHGQSRRKAGTS